MRKLLRSKKALSPVVAAIILIAVTVAVSIAVAAWMGALTFSFMGSSSLTITQVNTQGTSGAANSNFTLSIKNTGTKTVTIGQVKVNNVGKNFYNTTNAASPCTFPTGTSGTVRVTGPWTSGNPYEIDIYDASGTALGSTQYTP